MRRVVAVASYLMLALACDSTDGEPSGSDDAAEPLTCEVLADPGFCWTVGVDEAYLCLDGLDESGLFDADRTTCAFTGGTTVTFDDPVPVEDAEEWTLAFTVTDPDGGFCARFEGGSDSLLLDTLAGAVTTRATTRSYVVSCPDGTEYLTPDPFGLLDCVSPVPGHLQILQDGAITVALLGGVGPLLVCGS